MASKFLLFQLRPVRDEVRSEAAAVPAPAEDPRCVSNLLLQTLQTRISDSEEAEASHDHRPSELVQERMPRLPKEVFAKSCPPKTH